MPLKLIGKKCGMTRVFKEDGSSTPVSVVEFSNNRITQVKNMETDGYCAVQLTMGSANPSRLNKAERGHFEKAGVEPGTGLWEARLTQEELGDLAVGSQVKVEDVFKEGDKVDVAGQTKGHGFTGVIKRWNFRMQRATHGNSLAHRAPGSIGQNQTPGRVFKGKKMAGRMGNEQRTIQNLEIVKVDAERGLLLIKGAIPGAPNGVVFVSPALKVRNKDNAA